jgi:hypothetical protein
MISSFATFLGPYEEACRQGEGEARDQAGGCFADIIAEVNTMRIIYPKTAPDYGAVIFRFHGVANMYVY